MSYYIDNMREIARGLRLHAKKMQVQNHAGECKTKLRKGVTRHDEYVVIKAAEALESIAWSEEQKVKI